MIETGYLNAFDTELERVISRSIATHVFTTSGIVELPFGRGRRSGQGLERDHRRPARRLAGVGYIFKAQSGAPLGFGNFLFATGATIDDIRWPTIRTRSVVQRRRLQPRHRAAARVERPHSRPGSMRCEDRATRCSISGS